MSPADAPVFEPSRDYTEQEERNRRMQLMSVQIEQGHATLDQIRFAIRQAEQAMKRSDEEMARSAKLYRLEIWKVMIAAIGAAGIVGGVIGHLIR